MRTFRITRAAVVAGLVSGGMGCSADRAAPVSTPSPDHHPGEEGRWRHYVAQPGDPDWLAAVGRFHGHLGPWVVIGAAAGRDAVARLKSEGYWDLEVVCYMPAERQRQPWSCILDGLQVATGATLGKQNIRFSSDASVLGDGRPVVLVIHRQPPAGGPAAASYRVSPSLAQALAHLNPEHLEALSRDLAARPIDWLFEVQTLGPEQLATQFERQSPGPR